MSSHTFVKISLWFMMFVIMVGVVLVGINTCLTESEKEGLELMFLFESMATAALMLIAKNFK